MIMSEWIRVGVRLGYAPGSARFGRIRYIFSSLFMIICSIYKKDYRENRAARRTVPVLSIRD